MTIDVPLRRAGPEDVPAMAGVVNDWIDATGWLTRGPSRGAIEGMLRDALPAREMWVIGDPVAGYISIIPETGHIGALYCRKTGVGHGKALLDQAKEGRDRLKLNTHAANTAAHRFYFREGFTQVGRVDAGVDGIPELVLEWVR